MLRLLAGDCYPHFTPCAPALYAQPLMGLRQSGTMTRRLESALDRTLTPVRTTLCDLLWNYGLSPHSPIDAAQKVAAAFAAPD